MTRAQRLEHAIYLIKKGRYGRACRIVARYVTGTSPRLPPGDKAQRYEWALSALPRMWTYR